MPAPPWRTSSTMILGDDDRPIRIRPQKPRVTRREGAAWANGYRLLMHYVRGSRKMDRGGVGEKSGYRFTLTGTSTWNLSRILASITRDLTVAGLRFNSRAKRRFNLNGSNSDGGSLETLWLPVAAQPAILEASGGSRLWPQVWYRKLLRRGRPCLDSLPQPQVISGYAFMERERSSQPMLEECRLRKRHGNPRAARSCDRACS